jgi:flavin-binding protein dodecin
MPLKQAATKVRPMRPRAAGAVDYAPKAAMMDPGAVLAHDDHVYRVIEIVGTSEDSIDDAIRLAVARAEKTLRHLRWFEVVRTSGHIANGAVEHFQVTLKVGFTMEGPSH